MNEGIIAFLMAAGASAWIFNQTAKRTGNSNVKSVATAAIAGALVFMIVLTILWFAPDVSLF